MTFADGIGFRVRVRVGGRTYAKRFATLEDAGPFARALAVLVSGPAAWKTDEPCGIVSAALVREVQVWLATKLGDAPMPAMIATRFLRVCEHIKADGTHQQKPKPGAPRRAAWGWRGRFFVELRGQQHSATSLNAAMRWRGETLRRLGPSKRRVSRLAQHLKAKAVSAAPASNTTAK